jgi:hypothetical protein
MTLGKLLPDHRVCHERPVQCERERERERKRERKKEREREDRCIDKRVEINGSILGFLC